MLLNTRNVPTSRLTMLKAVRFNRKAPSSCCACPVRSDGVTASTRPSSPSSMRAAQRREVDALGSLDPDAVEGPGAAEQGLGLGDVRHQGTAGPRKPPIAGSR